MLSAHFFENTRILEVVSIEKLNEETKPVIDEVPLSPELTVEYLTARYSGSHHLFNGYVKNSGKVPLKNVVFILYLSGGDNNYEHEVQLEPDVLEAGQDSYFDLEFVQSGLDPYYDFAFYSGDFIIPVKIVALD